MAEGRPPLPAPTYAPVTANPPVAWVLAQGDRLRRYPIAALAAALGCSEHSLCVLFGVSGSTMQDYRRRGVTLEVAERLAHRAGIHPFCCWPSMPEDRRREQWASSARRRWATDAGHRERRAVYMRQYRADSSRAIAAQKRAWNDANREKIRAQNREAMRRLRANNTAARGLESGSDASVGPRKKADDSDQEKLLPMSSDPNR